MTTKTISTGVQLANAFRIAEAIELALQCDRQGLSPSLQNRLGYLAEKLGTRADLLIHAVVTSTTYSASRSES